MAAPRLYAGGTVTPIAPVTALPTTAAQLVLWNGEPLGGQTYSVDALGWTTIVSAGAAFVGQLLALVIPAVTTVPGGTTAKGPFPTDGLANSSRGAVVSAVTLTAGQAANGVWHPVGRNFNSVAATATISGGAWQNVQGLYLLPPGGLLALAVLCSAAGSATCDIFVNWRETQ